MPVRDVDPFAKLDLYTVLYDLEQIRREERGATDSAVTSVDARVVQVRACVCWLKRGHVPSLMVFRC